MKQLTLIAIALGLLVLSLSAFTVAEFEYAVKFRLGKIVQTDFEPGLHWQVPIVNSVRKFDRRILALDARPQRFITFEKKDVIVDSFLKFKIADVGEFYRATQGDLDVARSRLSQIIADGLRTEFAKRTLKEVVSTEREEIMSTLSRRANETAESLGIEIVDVRIKRIDLPEEVGTSVFSRMRAERKEVANELRAEGREQAEIIEATAEREVRILVAEARRDSERIRGEGDARAADLYAQAYARNPEFYAFFRSLQAYRNAFGGQDVMLLDSGSEFFEYFDAQQSVKD